MAKVLSEVSGKKIETSHISKEAFYDPALAQKVTPELWINYDFFYRRCMTCFFDCPAL